MHRVLIRHQHYCSLFHICPNIPLHIQYTVLCVHTPLTYSWALLCSSSTSLTLEKCALSTWRSASHTQHITAVWPQHVLQKDAFNLLPFSLVTLLHRKATLKAMLNMNHQQSITSAASVLEEGCKCETRARTKTQSFFEVCLSIPICKYDGSIAAVAFYHTEHQSVRVTFNPRPGQVVEHTFSTVTWHVHTNQTHKHKSKVQRRKSGRHGTTRMWSELVRKWDERREKDSYKETQKKAWRENPCFICLLLLTLTEWLRDTGGQGKRGADVWTSVSHGQRN